MNPITITVQVTAEDPELARSTARGIHQLLEHIVKTGDVPEGAEVAVMSPMALPAPARLAAAQTIDPNRRN